MFSLTLAPLNSKGVEAGLALDRVAAVAGVPNKRVITVAQERQVVATAAVITVSLPGLPVIISSPSPPLSVRLIWPAMSADASMVSLPAKPVDNERVVGSFGVSDGHLRGEPIDDDRAAAACDA